MFGDGRNKFVRGDKGALGGLGGRQSQSILGIVVLALCTLFTSGPDLIHIWYGITGQI